MNCKPDVSDFARLAVQADSPHIVRDLPVLVLMPHNRCNCRCLMCDIWKIRQTREISAQDLIPHLESLRRLNVRWVVFSGGEPLLHSDLAGLARLLREEGIRVTVLTAGLLLERFAQTVADNVDDVIVSLDGPQPIHDEIRCVPRAFARLADGVDALRRRRPAIAVRARCTVQKRNFRRLRATVEAARELGLNSVSFLAADVTTGAFNRPEGWPEDRRAEVALEPEEVKELAEEVEALILERQEEIHSGFVVENAAKLRRIVLHFHAQIGQTAPVAPRCNAPWVSAVVESDGTVRPCFFHPPVGNLAQGLLHEIVNGPQARAFRQSLDVFSDPVCRKCVCPLYIPQPPAG
ncbi:MAG TPA: radical SAM protein [Terriglobia bacterium]|nr:radical SAM protein [Terriglobia bacterium]